MLIHLSEVSSTEGFVERVETTYEKDTFPFRGVDNALTDRRSATLVLSNIGKGKVQIDGEFSVEAMIPCDRCLEMVSSEVSGDFSVEWDVAEQGEEADTDEILFTEILMKWPMKVLCKEDCMGICMKCGQNLNQGKCECDTFVPDPRMAAILDIFEKSKEV